MYCPECGTQNPSGAKFCHDCGRSFEDITPVAGKTVETPAGRKAPSRLDIEGEIIDKYRIVRKLGEGGMGAVFLAEHVSLIQPRAVKILPGSLAENKLYIQRFFKEAQSVASIDHPNIVRVHDAGEQDGLYYFAMEYVEGRSFSEVLREEGPLPWKDAVGVMKQALEAFRAAHDKHIIHRDVKPENIMQTTAGVVKVADFGLAKNVEETTGLTRTGQIMGTPSYMSPEQCRGDKTDHRSDIYSLGATFYALISGGPMFRAETPLAILQMHVSKEPRPLSEAVPGVPAALSTIIQRMLAKDANLRFQNVEEILKSLENLESAAASGYEETVTPAAKGEKLSPVTETPPPPLSKPAYTPKFEEMPSPSSPDMKREKASSATIDITYAHRFGRKLELIGIILLLIGSIGCFFADRYSPIMGALGGFEEPALAGLTGLILSVIAGVLFFVLRRGARHYFVFLFSVAFMGVIFFVSMLDELDEEIFLALLLMFPATFLFFLLFMNPLASAVKRIKYPEVKSGNVLTLVLCIISLAITGFMLLAGLFSFVAGGMGMGILFLFFHILYSGGFIFGNFMAIFNLKDRQEHSRKFRALLTIISITGAIVLFYIYQNFFVYGQIYYFFDDDVIVTLIFTSLPLTFGALLAGAGSFIGIYLTRAVIKETRKDKTEIGT